MQQPSIERIEVELTRLFCRAAHARVHTGTGQPSMEKAAYTALAHIAGAGALRASDLAASVGVDVSTASRQAAGLESAGLVQREPDPEDRRASLLSLTEQGRQVLETVQASRRAGLSRLLADWTADDRAQLGRLLQRFNDDISHDTTHHAENRTSA